MNIAARRGRQWTRDHDRHFGPFTYAPCDRHWRPFAFILAGIASMRFWITLMSICFAPSRRVIAAVWDRH